MDLGLCGSRVRCTTVWTAATAIAALLAAGLLPTALQGLRAFERGTVDQGGFADVLVWVCAVSGLAATCWLWLVTSAVVVDAGRGSAIVRRNVPPTVRRIVLMLCGVALSGSVAAPALAAGGGASPDMPHVLAGLRLPERVAVTPQAAAGTHRPAPHAPPAQERRTVVVASGDTLWSITADLLGPGATDAETARGWPQVHALNRELIGPDPGLIVPGQRLLIPTTGDEAGAW